MPLPDVEELTPPLGGCRLSELLDEDWLEGDVGDAELDELDEVDEPDELVELAGVDAEVDAWSVVDAVPGMVAAPMAPNTPTAAKAAAPIQTVSLLRS